MAYEKQTWQSNELLTSEKFNHMEDGIAGAKVIQTAVNDPIVNGTAVAFIDSIEQDAQGVITPTKKTVATATTSAAGLMSADDKTKLNGIAPGAQVNSVTGVKGDSEGSFRIGDVIITAANIGLGNVENKSSATIRGELTKANVTTALGYTPPTASDVSKREVLVVSATGVSSLNTTIENTAIETDMVCIKAELSNPVVQSSDWIVNTNTAGKVTISGSIFGSTDITLYLMKSNL